VRESDYAELRARAVRAPWREIAQEAERYAVEESFDPGASDYQAKARMTDLCGALALAWVLEPRPFLVDKLATTLGDWESFYVPTGATEGTQVRWRQSAMVSSILALDVMHDALPPGELAAIEEMLDGMVRGWWEDRALEGTTSTPGITAVWALYAGDRALLDAARELYFERLYSNMTPGGVYDVGPGYAWVRQSADRISKYALIDLLVLSGEDASLYEDPRLRTLHEWMYRGAYTPFRTNLTFGDTDSTRPLEVLQGYMQPYRAHRFSEQAGRNAAWLLRDVEPKPLLANYVLIDETFLDPEPPTSALWEDTAALWEDGASDESLMGALWSPRSSGSHSHKDVNAVHLCAYGVNVVRNSGYCGRGQGVDGTFDWDWVSSDALSSNTVTIAGVDHASKTGGGVTEGLTTPGFDYAAAGSGPALSNGSHDRSLLLVHGEPDLPGYFVLLDEVHADVPGAIATVALHPDSATQVTRVPRAAYDWTLDGPGAPVLATVFLGTEPLAAEVRDGGFCDFDGEEYVARYLRSDYATDSAGELGVVTIVFPHDAAHPLPALGRLTGGGLYSGARVDYGSATVDRVLESHADAPVDLGTESFWARGLYWRASAAGVQRYFVRGGRLFDDGADPRVGFESDEEVALVVQGTRVHVSSAGATVAFYDPALTGALAGTPFGTVLASAPGRVEIALDPGTHAFDLETGQPLE